MTTYFDASGINLGGIVDQETIDASDVRDPLQALVGAIETMDTNLDTDISDHESRLDTVESVVVDDQLDLPIVPATPSNLPSAGHVRLFIKNVGVSPNQVPQLHLIGAGGVVQPVARQNNSFASAVLSYSETTSTNFVVIPGSQIWLSTKGGDVLVGFSGSFRSFNTDFLYIDLAMDGQRVSGAGGNGLFVQINVQWDREAISPVYLFRDVPAGVHNFSMYWKLTDPSGNPPTNLASVAEYNTKPTFWAREF